MLRTRLQATAADLTLIRIDHAAAERKNILVVDWMLGNSCNYECHYCPPSLHNGSLRWVDSQKIMNFAERLAALCKARSFCVYFQFSGGEVTLLPNFLNMLGQLRELGCQLAILSNGSRSLDWWSDAVKFLDQVVLTFHPEGADLHHFTAVANLSGARIRTHLNVAAPPDFFEIAHTAAKHLAANCQDVTILLKPMLVDFGESLYPYTPEQINILKTEKFLAQFSRPVVSTRGEMLATLADGTRRVMQANQFLAEGLNKWRGWECNIGLELLSIAQSGAIYRGACREGGPVGHIDKYLEFALPEAPIICKKNACVCLLDVMTSRRDRRFMGGSFIREQEAARPTKQG
jgi:organic radical activating enzyme